MVLRHRVLGFGFWAPEKTPTPTAEPSRGRGGAGRPQGSRAEGGERDKEVSSLTSRGQLEGLKCVIKPYSFQFQTPKSVIYLKNKKRRCVLKWVAVPEPCFKNYQGGAGSVPDSPITRLLIVAHMPPGANRQNALCLFFWEEAGGGGFPVGFPGKRKEKESRKQKSTSLRFTH